MAAGTSVLRPPLQIYENFPVPQSLQIEFQRSGYIAADCRSVGESLFERNRQLSYVNYSCARDDCFLKFLEARSLPEGCILAVGVSDKYRPLPYSAAVEPPPVAPRPRALRGADVGGSGLGDDPAVRGEGNGCVGGLRPGPPGDACLQESHGRTPRYRAVVAAVSLRW